MLKTLFSSVTIFVVAFANQTYAESQSFTDFEFSSWTVVTSQGTGLAAASSLKGFGGNPGNYYRENWYPSPIDNPEWVISLHGSPDSGFDPSLLCPISTIDYTADLKVVGAQVSGVTTGPMLIQDGEYYILAIPLVLNFESWITEKRLGLTSADFVRVSQYGPGGIDISRHPDLSGPAIGLGMFYYSGAYSGLTNTVELGVDNWSVTVNFVPESTALSLGLSAITILSLGRWRRLVAY